MTCRPAALGAPILLLALTVLTACGTDGRAQDDTSPAPAASGSVDPTATTSAAPWPAFGVSDYRYRLRVLCYCPQIGPVEVTVVDGAVTTAVLTRGAAAGSDAPDYARLSIDDIIDAANAAATGSGSADVIWPDDSDHPTSVSVDRIQGAVDDEVTYTIRAVEVS